jgi:hypothetical protein
MKYPKWFPYPSSWLNALLLSLLAGMNIYVIASVFIAGSVLAQLANRPDWLIPVISLTLLSPIVAIAIVHHVIHLGLSRYCPSLQAPEIGTVKGVMPNLMSWWEGIWGCAAIVIASVVTILIGWLIHPLFSIDYQSTLPNGDSEKFFGCVALVWLTCAAYLYHCFYLVEARLMTVAKGDRRGSTVGKSVPQ